MTIYRELLHTLKSGNKAVLVTNLDAVNDHQGSSSKILINENDDPRTILGESLDSKAVDMVEKAFATGDLQYDADGGLFVEPYFPEPQLIVLGGGHIAKPLVELGARAGFVVTVADDRPYFANQERFPEAQTVICDSFSNCFKQLQLNKSSYVVIVTRGHRHDLECLKETLEYTTAYTGMIGSRRRVASVREMLLEEGYSEEKLAKVCSPIGIDIGAVTPDEIAISIIAEVIRHRRKNNLRQNRNIHDRLNWPEYDRDVLEELSEPKTEPKAIVTIVSSKGSVPRKAGAKMLVYPDGRISGSIGGGCSEAEVITTAYDVIRSSEYALQKVDMTGEVAENEGMVCGGVMEVIVEPW